MLLEVMPEVLLDLAKLGFSVAVAYFVLQAGARRWSPGWSARLGRRHIALLGGLSLAMLAIKLTEDVVARESRAVDTAILWFVREQVPAALDAGFAALSRSGSAACLVPVAMVAAAGFWLARWRFEAWMVGTSMALAVLLIYLLKTVVGRARPALWPSDAYWGSSFPSGHTLATAALSTALALCLGRRWPRSAAAAMVAALLWSGGVGLSRLVLGVHWPSDVLTAICLGMFVPLSLSVLFDPGLAGLSRD